MRPPAQNTLVVEGKPILVAPGARCGHTITRLPVEDLIHPSRFTGWSALRECGRSKALLNFFLGRAQLSMGEESFLVGFETGASADSERKKDNGERRRQLHA